MLISTNSDTLSDAVQLEIFYFISLVKSRNEATLEKIKKEKLSERQNIEIDPSRKLAPVLR